MKTSSLELKRANISAHAPASEGQPENQSECKSLRARSTEVIPSSFGMRLAVYPDPVLRTVCPPVEQFDTGLRELVEDMLGCMRFHGGIGLAAPQVALEKRLFVCGMNDEFLVLANPQIKEAGQEGEMVEGCLSLPFLQVNVPRPERVEVTGYDPSGRKQSLTATGLWARVIQHEMDHLNGVLICDHPQ